MSLKRRSTIKNCAEKASDVSFIMCEKIHEKIDIGLKSTFIERCRFYTNCLNLKIQSSTVPANIVD